MRYMSLFQFITPHNPFFTRPNFHVLVVAMTVNLKETVL